MTDDLERLKARISDAGLDAADAMNEAIARIEALQADNARLREVLDDMRLLVPRAMKTIMYQGRDGLLLADEIHKADDKARAALNTGKEPSHE